MRKLLFLIACTVFLSSCNDELQMEKTLEGKWNIAEANYKFSGIADSSFTISNLGSLTLNKDYTGEILYDYGSSTERLTITGWSTTISTVTIVAKNSSGSNEIYNYDVLTNESKKQVWTKSETDNGLTTKETITLTK